MNNETFFDKLIAQISDTSGVVGVYEAFTGIFRITSLILILIFLGLSFFIFIKIIAMLRKEEEQLLHVYDVPETPEEAVEQYIGDWSQIEKHVNSLQEGEWKLAVIEADKLVDDVLRAYGYQGESMGERMMSINPNSFVTLQELWDAHKLRNSLVHDVHRSIGHDQAVAAVHSYGRFLQELGFFR